MAVVAAPEYLARAGTPRHPRELRKHACLVDTNFRDGGRWPFEFEGRVHRVDVEGPYRVNHPHLIRDLAEGGQGVALVLRFLVAPALARGTLVEVPVGRPALDWAIYALYPRRRFLSSRVRAFIDHLAAWLDEIPDFAA